MSSSKVSDSKSVNSALISIEILTQNWKSMYHQLCISVQEIGCTVKKVAVKTIKIKPQKRPSNFLDVVKLYDVSTALSIMLIKTRVNCKKRTG